MSEESISYEGEHYRFRDLSFVPKRRLPIWVGGEGKAAQRRSARYGDAWFPYYVRITPDDLRAGHENVRRLAREYGRDPDAVALTACAAVQLTPQPVPQEPDRLRGTPEQVVEALRAYERAGVEHVALQFMVPKWPERKEQIARFAEEALPALTGA
jgi:alkanesulfonate monooxygenase SsuD/methylene tetrahydromethanopterin reductase-like flavin-dependent oxidoreductase (luciferase family)